jgi:antitoxin ParD1/3/4
MARELAVHLDDARERFIEQQLESGRFGSAAEVLEVALALLEERESRLSKLRETIEHAERTHRGDLA